MRPGSALVLVALVLFLAGCSATQGPAEAPSDDDAEAPADPPPAIDADDEPPAFDAYYEPPPAGAFGEEETRVEENLTIAPHHEQLWGLNVTTDAAVVRFEARIVGEGREIRAIIHPAQNPNLESANRNGWAQADGMQAAGAVWLGRGPYALGVWCRSAEPCDVHVRASVQEAPAVVHPSGCVSAPALPAFIDGSVLVWRPREAPSARSSFLVVESPATHRPGKGDVGNYSSDVSTVTLTVDGRHVRALVAGWDVSVTLPERCPTLERGFYPNLLRDPFRGDAQGGVEVSRSSRACGAEFGHVIVDEARYDDAGQLAELWLRLAHQCESHRAPPLLAQLHWTRTPSIPSCGAGPSYPSEDLLLPRWDVAEGTVPFSPHLFLEGPGGSRDVTYSVDDGLAVTADRGTIRVTTAEGGNEFHLPYYCDRVVPGFYAPAGMLILLGPPGCFEPLGSALAIDEARYDDGGKLRELTLRYEQVCASNGDDGRRLGKLVWSADAPPERPPDCALRAAPVDAGEPRTLPSWRPPVEVPGDRNFAYLSSVPDDGIGDGRDRVLEGTNSVVVRVERGQVGLVAGDLTGAFVLPADCPRPVVGDYEARCATPRDPEVACFNLRGATRGCALPQGRVLVDAADYAANASLERLVLRFEQRCDGRPAFLGLISWAAAPPAGSGCAQPTDAPAAAALAAWQPTDEPTGSYALVEREDGGARATFTGFLSAYTYASSNQIRVGKPDMSFGAHFAPGAGCGLPEVGYYAAPPASLSVQAGAACSSDVGEFLVDEVTYVDGRVKTLTLRFRQECSGAEESPLRGKVHLVQ